MARHRIISLRQMKAGDWLRLFAGWLCLLVGILGLVLPGIQGILTIALASLLLSPYIPFFHRTKLRLYKAFPRVRWTVERAKRSWHDRRRRSS